MIPVRLELRDFLSYRDPQPISFEGFDVVCLSGANGQGKSSLLDAITWSVWGAARGCEGGQNQDRLINDSADATSVTFTFDLGGDRYRIARSRTRSGRADVRFEVRSGDGWTNLAGETLRETEARIGSVLRMDYRTFTASALFLQGRSDDFLRMRPEERKDVFGRLLDLAVYDQLEQESRRRAREAERLREEHGTRVAALEERTAGLGELRDRCAAAAAACEAAAKVAEARDAEVERLRTHLVDAERRAAAQREERKAVAELTGRLRTDEERLATKQAELREVDELLRRRDEVASALGEARMLRERETALRDAERLHAENERRRAEVAGRIDAAAKGIEATLVELERRSKQIAIEVERLDEVAAAVRTADEQLGGHEEAERSLEATRERLQDLRETDARLGAELEELVRRTADIHERIGIVARGEGECPVCGGPLDDTHRVQLVRRLEADRADVDAERLRVEGRREVVRKEGRLLREEEQRLKRTVEELTEAARHVAGLRARLERLPELRTEGEALEREMAEARQALASAAFALDERAALTRLEAAAADVGYDRADHERVRARLEELAPFEQLAGALEAAERSRSSLRTEIDDLAQRIDTERTRLDERLAALERDGDATGAATVAAKQVAEAEREATEARRRAAEAAGERVRLTEQVSALEVLERDLEDTKRRERDEARQHRMYKRLSTAFGRGGIPDRIIENALPELQDEANAILGRLSEYEMSVTFVMDKPTKAGKSRETFEVLVHHDGGVRDFHMFSGGEAFRIAFAIRMGLSKLLVRRAGARLETLVIDEGFGTQDPQGRERIVEAINLARREFRKVIVISHLDELKDAFGARMQVTKDEVHGSQVQLAGG